MSIAANQPASAPGAAVAPPPPTPDARLFQLLSASMVGQLLQIVLKFQLARRVLDGPRSSAELAQMTGLHEPSLYRVLRALTVVGVFTEQPGRRFALGPLGPPATKLDEDLLWLEAAIDELPQTLQTGTTGMELAHGMSFFDYITRHPAAGRGFDHVMAITNDGVPQIVADTYDFTAIHTLVDVGGGNGTWLAAILQRHAHLRGVLFELPAVIERGAPALTAIGERCGFVGGDFFDSMPARGDAFLLSHIVHDWDDDRATAILNNCRDAMSSGSKLLLVEKVIPADGQPHPAKMTDVTMLALTGGMERTEAEYADLLDRAGFRFTRVFPTPSPVSIIEAVPADTP